RIRRGLVQVNGLLTKLCRVVLPGHDDDHLASSSPCWIPRVHNPGSGSTLTSQGAYFPKDNCKSWHAAGRALDFAQLRRGNEVLVNCRTDLWPGQDEAIRTDLVRRYWTLAASLNLHFEYVLTHHFDDEHANHIHVDNGISGEGFSTFHRRSQVQNQSVQAICLALWGREGQVTGQWEDTEPMVSPVLDELQLGDLRGQENWHAFLRASVRRG
ncbi:hypothetical protein ACTQ49_14600, partial [Luteococcus sp. Sow4_B9]|uniref:hypothetical protein n=1 Tax=Luteococcus sp. Sow4_B9 TaxID=3438792 RepID=UPI003F99567D